MTASESRVPIAAPGEVGIDEVPFLPYDEARVLVASEVNATKRAAGARDSEVAHASEDKAWEAALTWISEQGDERSKALAWLALSTQYERFERWTS